MASTDNTTVAVDMKEMKALVGQIKKVSPRVYRVLREDLLEAGEAIATRAREISSQHSTTIPSTIGVRLMAITQRHGVGIRVYAGGLPGGLSAAMKDALTAFGGGNAIAGLYEEGNRRGGRNSTTFRHPVFGGDTWVAQPRYPFLRPAAIEVEVTTEERVAFAIENAVSTMIRAGA